jgi:hypothetical protein
MVALLALVGCADVRDVWRLGMTCDGDADKGIQAEGRQAGARPEGGAGCLGAGQGGR